jgi:trigger factor
LDISLLKSTPTEGQIKITLKEIDYQSQFEEKLRSYSRQLNMKGFRPGRVPVGLVKKLYGKTILVEEINKILSESLSKYIKENDIRIIGDPLPNHEKANEIDWDSQKDFDFEYEVGLVDAFALDLKVKVTRFDIALKDKEVEEAFENLRRQYGRSVNAEKVEEGSYLEVELRPAGAEEPLPAHIDTAKLTKKSIKKLTGLAPQAVEKVEIQSLFDQAEDLAHALGKTEQEARELKGNYELAITAIHRWEPAPLDQSFFDLAFGRDSVKTEEECRARHRDMIGENNRKESDYLLSRDLQKKLLDSTAISLPEQFYRKWLLTANSGISEDALEKDFEHYIRDLKWSLIKARIAEEHQVKVENEEVIARAKQFFAEQYGLHTISDEASSTLDALVHNYLQKNDGEQYLQMFQQVRTEKIMEVVKQQAQIAVKTVSREDFMKKVGEPAE